MATSRSAASNHPRALGPRVLLSGVAIFVALALVEVSARVVYYQLVGKQALAGVEGTIWLQQGLRRRRVAAELEDPFGVPALYREARERLRTPVGAAMRTELERVYERWFDELVADVRAAGARLVVVDFLEGRSRPFGAFIAELATGRDVACLDIADRVRALGGDDGTLRPGDGHLSRYANLRVAAALAEGLVPFAGHRSGSGYAGRPRIVADGYDAYPGDGRRELVEMKPGLGFCLVRNAQGFRNVDEVEIPKTRARVLCLGDSYTFGDHLNNQDTVPAMLARSRPGWEVLNAGISGYTIADQARLFAERARLVAPDVVLLQVCENDLVELLTCVRSPLQRRPAHAGVSDELERDFLAVLRRGIAESRR